MLLIACPYCGPRDQVEYSYGGDANVRRPADPSASTDAEWSAYLNERGNPAGEHDELWQHAMGCRRWIAVRRNTLTHEVVSARTLKPVAST
ncbi:MAG: sarcosine oxidase subunit delta [Burkholderiales bacterium]|nr:sarcosine oxidase subunit delta [Burkholderiales bacterium]